jgi:hypothetical protein
MAEAFSFSEGTANFVTGGATAAATFVRDIQGTKTIGYFKYRPPFATTWVHYETGREATLSIGQVYSQKDLGIMFDGATAGGVHVQIVHVAAGITGTLWLYSGVIDSHSLNGNDGDVMQRTLQGRFQAWSET